MQEFRKFPDNSKQGVAPQAKPSQTKPPQAKTEKIAALDDTARLPAVPSSQEAAHKTGHSKAEFLEALRRGRLEVATALGLKGEAIAKISAGSSLPLEAYMRLKPFEDQAKFHLGRVPMFEKAVKRLEKALGVTLSFTDLMILAYHPDFLELRPLRDHAKTQALFTKMKGTSKDVMLDRLLSSFSSKRRERGNMRIVVNALEKMGDKLQSGATASK